MKKDLRPENCADVMWELIMSDDPAVIARLEAKLEGTQGEAVDEYIENSCWSEDLPHLVGRRGTALERRAALRAAYRGESVPQTSLAHVSGEALDELKELLSYGPPYDPGGLAEWFTGRSAVLLIELQILKSICRQALVNRSVIH